MSRKTVLIIDDAYSMRSLLKKALKEAGYEVVGEAKNGAEGIQMYFDKKPDVTIMDITLPDISGIDAIKRIIEKSPNAMIIAIAGENNESIKKQVTEAGALEYLRKPFQPAFLWAKLDKVFSLDIQKEKESVPVGEKKNEVSDKKAVPIISVTNNEDSFEDTEIEILDKPDESKSQIILIENPDDWIEFPDDDPEEKKKNELNEENIIRLEQEKQNHKSEGEKLETHAQSMKSKNEERLIEQNEVPDYVTIAPSLFSKPSTLRSEELPVLDEDERNVRGEMVESLRVELENRRKIEQEEVENAKKQKTPTTINIRPPRAKVLKEYEEYDDIRQPSLNDIDNDIYNNTSKNSGLFGKVRKLFKK